MDELNIERPRDHWLRESAKIMEVIRQLEVELQSMKDRKVNQNFIDSKDFQISQLVNFYNTTEQMMLIYQNELTIMRLNVKYTELIFKTR